MPADAERVSVRSVTDGDTLRLKGGEIIRLIGIDTPELAHDGKPEQPYARDAKAALRGLVEAAGRELLVQRGTDPKDRYHRTLAHLFSPRGESLTAELLKQGLGYQAVVAPNLAHLECYREAEREAREAGRGLWSKPLREASDLGPDETGFHLLRGRVARVTTHSRAVWLELTGGLRVKIPRQVWERLAEGQTGDFTGRKLEVRGWLYRRQGSLRVAISHPAALRWL